MHFVSFTFYSPVSDYFVTVQITAEFLVSGLVYPTGITVLPFKGNIFELNNEKNLQFADILRFLLCFYLLYCIYVKLRYTSQLPGIDFPGLMLGLFIDMGILSFFYASWIIQY